MKTKTIDTLWEVRTYDVWGNQKDGYEVNDSCVVHREYELTIPATVNNPGTPQEFESAYPTDRQIREALGIKPRVRLSLDGDDLHITVDHESTGYPLGELNCVSHESLSPIRVRTVGF
jgi:hypothetical protein